MHQILPLTLARLLGKALPRAKLLYPHYDLFQIMQKLKIQVSMDILFENMFRKLDTYKRKGIINALFAMKIEN